MHKSSRKSVKVSSGERRYADSRKGLCIRNSLLEVGGKRRLISLLAMGQRQRRAVYGKSVRTVR